MKFWDTDEDAIYRWDGVAWVLPVPAAHDILSTRHGDTTPAAVVRGDLMTGQGVAPAWQRLAHPGVAKLLLHTDLTESEWLAFDWDDVSMAPGANMVHHHSAAGEGGQLDWDDVWSDAVHTHESAAEGGEDIRPDALGVNTPVPNVDGVIAQAEAGADPASGGAGTTRLYSKDDAGQSKMFYMDDAGNVYELSGILEDVTVTVGAAGDFATIQGAVDWMKSWLIKGACIILELDEAAYDEAVSFASILIAPGATLTLRGDTRVLPGITYVDTSVDATDMMNLKNLANGGDGICTLSTNVARDQITVVGSIANPDFDADGIVAGDRVIVYADDGTIYEKIVKSIDPGGAGTNVIEITVALPAGASLGNDGTAIGLLPNRAIENTTGGICIFVDAVKGVNIDGWYLETTNFGIHITNGGLAICTNVLTRAAVVGFASYPGYASLFAADGACSAWDSAFYGFYVAQASQIDPRFSVAVDCGYGYYTTYQGWMFADQALSTECATQGFHASIMAAAYVGGCCARQCTTGYYAQGRGYLYAINTNAKNNGNGADYNPAVSDVWGNNNGSITWT